MNIEDIKKITDMALANAERIILLEKKTQETSILLEAHGVLCFASTILMKEKSDMVINNMREQADEVTKMLELINEKLNAIWER